MNKQRLTTWSQWVLVTLLIVSHVLAAYAVLNSRLVPGKYLFLVPIAMIVVVLLVVTLCKIARISSIKRIGVMVAALLFIAVNMYVYVVGSSTTRFLATIEQGQFSTIEYSIVAKKALHISLKSNRELNAGIIAVDTNAAAVKTEADKKMKATHSDYNELTSLILAVEDAKADVAVIKSSYMQLLQENSPSFYRSVEVLDTFVVKISGNTKAASADLTKPFIIYISGIDVYGDMSSTSRSDVNMLAVVNPRTNKVLLVNTPRDYYVQLHGTSGVKDKLTHAGIYGIDMSVKTLEDLYDTPINYYMRVNFSSLINIVDALGGVDVYSDYEFTSGSDRFVAGYNYLNAEQALNFSRTRYAFEEGDRVRGQNQQRVIEAIIQKLNNPKTLVSYQHILQSLQGSFQTNMTTDEMTTLIRRQLETMDRWTTESVSVSGVNSQNTTYSMGNLPLYVMEPNADSVDNVKRLIEQQKR